MELRSFLSTVITSSEGWLNLCHSNADGSEWTELWYRYPEDIDRVIAKVHKLKDHNVYFSPYLFSGKQSTKDNAIVGRTIVADLDDANVLTLQYKPTILVETSSNRHQGYWILDDSLGREEHERTSKNLTYSIPACDLTGWFLGKRVRVPDTINYKYEHPSTVSIASNGENGGIRTYQSSEFSVLAQAPVKSQVDYDISDEWIARAISSTGPQELLAKIRDKLPTKVYTQYNRQVVDRSAALWALTTNAFRIGLNTEQVFVLARGSANNKFTDLRFNGDRELLKDVIRARSEVHSGHVGDIKNKIFNIRRLPGSKLEKNMFIAEQIREDMKARGQFISCVDGTAWFIEEKFGKPIPVVTRGEGLTNFLENIYGINGSEHESHYIIANLISYMSTLPHNGILSSLSFYDTDSNTILIHGGRKEVLRVTSTTVENVINGYDGIVFPWISATEIMEPSYRTQDKSWDDILFNNALDNITGLESQQAQALLKVWILMLLLRKPIVSRPILAVFGQPGAGKSTLFRRIYTLLYGRYKSLSSITSPDNFDFSTAADPLVIFDNVDTWEKWLPDRLALAAAASEVTKRKLYTNNDVVTMKRQAFIGITAHNPKFGREDVADRLILLTLERLTHFTSETEIIDYIFKNRGILWGAIIQDLQKILSIPMPTSGYPQFRIEDFSKYGYWIASALNIKENFASAIKAISSSQKSFSLEEDQLLIDAVDTFITKGGDTSQYRTSGQWFSLLESKSRDQQSFQKMYRNAVILGKKFLTLQDSMKVILNVDMKYDAKQGARTWKFTKKEES